MPTFIAMSGVIGYWFARPRMPSVPKYLRAIGLDVARLIRLPSAVIAPLSGNGVEK